VLDARAVHVQAVFTPVSEMTVSYHKVSKLGSIIVLGLEH